MVIPLKECLFCSWLWLFNMERVYSSFYLTSYALDAIDILGTTCLGGEQLRGFGYNRKHFCRTVLLWFITMPKTPILSLGTTLLCFMTSKMSIPPSWNACSTILTLSSLRKET